MKRAIRNELRAKIERVMTEFPQARNSDQWLTIKIWTLYHPMTIDWTDKANPKIALRDIMSMEREDNVKRIRAVIQNEEKRLLPTSWEVAKQRKINEGEWKEYIRNLNESKRL